MTQSLHSRQPVAIDVLVVGAGSAGVAAAVSAAEEGARTLLVDAAGSFGGTLCRGNYWNTAPASTIGKGIRWWQGSLSAWSTVLSKTARRPVMCRIMSATPPRARRLIIPN
ncbi:FAD-dependent oxidoreductase [Candidatus Sodalis endolongispinus]|uniref:FAD-dependent oxidoreductase n=1 Tax=Candidatus Sodalis endolongispinus TaxID=2812662 RepID=A0ABS5YFQ2_9GAMM|nr:FAD-dependent oxidoreductase [Candidatus Sodalis endolongispinus]